MGREVKRVPVDFDWLLNEVWQGYLMPDRLHEDKCPDCKSGYSPQAEHLFDLWYGYAPFDPASNGSTPLTADTPAVRAFAERNVTNSPAFYGSGVFAISREAQRLADLWNGQWSHHLAEDDVAALLEADRLWDLTRQIGPNGWEDIDPKPVPTPQQVNEWSILGFGHDSINASVVVRARCVREGQPEVCSTCQGHGSAEVYEGQRAEAEAWEPTEPPTGEGWQLWETVSEGSPISPVFPDAEGLAQWLTTKDACWGAMKEPMTVSAARAFVGEGWAPTLIGNAGGIHEGADYVGTEKVLKDIENGGSGSGSGVVTER
jgi:hypothetical protein